MCSFVEILKLGEKLPQAFGTPALTCEKFKAFYHLLL